MGTGPEACCAQYDNFQHMDCSINLMSSTDVRSQPSQLMPNDNPPFGLPEGSKSRVVALDQLSDVKMGVGPRKEGGGAPVGVVEADKAHHTATSLQNGLLRSKQPDSKSMTPGSHRCWPPLSSLNLSFFPANMYFLPASMCLYPVLFAC